MMAVPPFLRPALDAPLHVAGGVNTLGRSLWLYLALVLHASNEGVVLRGRQRFAEGLGVSESAIDAWLERLVAAKLIDVQSASPFLVISLRSWPRSGVVAGNFKSPVVAGSSTAAAPVAASAVAEKENKNKQSSLRSRDGGLGEGSSVLADLRAVLGESDAADLEPVVATYPEAIVRRAIDRVRTTPSRQIKKSRAAFLRFLLKNSSDSTHDHPPTLHPQP